MRGPKMVSPKTGREVHPHASDLLSIH